MDVPSRLLANRLLTHQTAAFLLPEKVENLLTVFSFLSIRSIRKLFAHLLHPRIKRVVVPTDLWGKAFSIAVLQQAYTK